MTNEATAGVPEVQGTGEATAAVETTAPASNVLTGQEKVDVPVEEVKQEVTIEQHNDFLSSLPDDLKSVALKKGFKGTEDALKAYSELEGLMGRRFEDLTAEEIQKMNTKLGAPETPDGYELKLPEGVEDDGSLADYAKFAHENGLSKEKAESLYNWYMEQQLEAAKIMQANHQQLQKEQVEQLKQDFGTAFDERIDLANQALRQYGGDEVIKALSDAGLANNPALVKMFSEIGKLTAEDKAVGQATTQSFGVTPGEAQAKIAELYKDKAFMERWSNSQDPGHAQAVRQLEQLYKLTKGIK